MKQTLLLLFFAISFFANTAFAQNLVPNPSFENGSCVVNYNSTPQEIPNTINDWYSCTGASPDPFDVCGTYKAVYKIVAPDVLFGYQYAHTGNRYMGFGFYGAWYEYIGCKLTQPLEAGETYVVSYYVSCADNMLWAADQIGVYFSTSDISYPSSNAYGTKLNYTPQAANAVGNFITDTTWQRVNTSFVAAGGEQYIVIGYFKTVANADMYLFPDPGNGLKRKANPNYQPTVAGTGTTSAPRCYYYIDDVSVEKVAAASLPIGLSGFSAKLLNQQAKLNWTTLTESNNCRFDIERSSNGSTFSSIGNLPGAVNSTKAIDYSFIDKSPLPGVSYYRLKQNDCDGKFSNSKIIKVNNEAAGFSVYPNPASNQLTIDRNKAAVSYAKVYDLTGRILSSTLIKNNRETINVSNLLPGNYIIKIENGQDTQSQKFIKQ